MASGAPQNPQVTHPHVKAYCSQERNDDRWRIEILMREPKRVAWALEFHSVFYHAFKQEHLVVHQVVR